MSSHPAAPTHPSDARPRDAALMPQEPAGSADDRPRRRSSDSKAGSKRERREHGEDHGDRRSRGRSRSRAGCRRPTARAGRSPRCCPRRRQRSPTSATERAIDSRIAMPSASCSLCFVIEEQGVVDAHAEPDHHRERGGDGGIETTWPTRPITLVATASANDGGQDRHAHRDQAPEDQREDHHRRRCSRGSRSSSVSGVDSSLPIGPPTATSMPASRAGFVAASTLLRELLGDEAGVDAQQHGHEAGRAVVGDDARLLAPSSRRGSARCTRSGSASIAL